MKLPGAGLASLRSRNFRVYLAGQLVSLCGTSAQQVGVSWLMYQLSGSSALVGLTVLLLQLPILALAPLGGMLADRYNRRSVLLATQIAGMVQALALGILTLAGAAAIDSVLALSLLMGVVNSVDAPGRQSIVPRLIDRTQDIRNAVALNAASFHVARLLGAAVAAVVLARSGAAACFMLNAASYLAAIAALLRLPRARTASLGITSGSSLGSALRFCCEQRTIRTLFALLIVFSLAVVPYTSLLPAAVRQWSTGAASDYARLMTLAGAGAVSAALLLAAFHDVGMLRRFIPMAALVSGAGLLGIGAGPVAVLSRELPLVVTLLGFCITMVVSGSNVVLQYQVPESLRGRVMGLFVTSFNGVAALGALSCGAVADHLGLATAFTAAGSVGALAALLGLLSAARGVRPVRQIP